MFMQLAHRLRRFALALTVLTATGCNTLDPKAVQTQTHGKTIAVASELGSNLNLQWVGTTIFNNEKGEIAVPAWKIDEQATKAMSTALLASQRYVTVTALTGISQLGDAVPKLPKGTKADFLLLIGHFNGGDPIYGSNQTFQGLGIAQRSFMGLEPPTQAHVGVTIQLFDLTANKSVGSSSEFEHWPITAKLKSGGDSNWGSNSNPVPSMDERELAALQQPFTTHLIQVIEQLISKMGMR
ncbi:MAG: hypothetical protein A2342_05055 [Gallionellales bacterium RIFOXYB12_FULL_54_9]|nr:MAG: hypothetical protein A2342_05055 [Gallionellales bacterium RIFOXYB12_FULL_54_9]